MNNFSTPAVQLVRNRIVHIRPVRKMTYFSFASQPYRFNKCTIAHLLVHNFCKATSLRSKNFSRSKTQPPFWVLQMKEMFGNFVRHIPKIEITCWWTRLSDRGTKRRGSSLLQSKFFIFELVCGKLMKLSDKTEFTSHEEASLSSIEQRVRFLFKTSRIDAYSRDSISFLPKGKLQQLCTSHSKRD